MKALKIIGTLAAIGGVYFLFFFDDEEKKEEKSQENATPNKTPGVNNKADQTEKPASLIKDISIDLAPGKQENPPTNQIEASFLMANKSPNISKDERLLMIPIKEQLQINPIEEHLPKISTDGRLPMIPIEEPINPIELKPINSSQKSIKGFPIAKGDPEKFRFDAIESKKGGVVPIIIYSLVETEVSTGNLIVFFSETKEQVKILDFLPEQAKRLNQKELSVSISVFISHAPAYVWSYIDMFVKLLNSHGVETLPGT